MYCRDLVCLAATLFKMGQSEPVPGFVRELSDAVEGVSSLYAKLITALLSRRAYEATVETVQADVWDPCLALIKEHLGSDVAGEPTLQHPASVVVPSRPL